MIETMLFAIVVGTFTFDVDHKFLFTNHTFFKDRGI